MYAAPDHRSREDAAFEPQGEGWMYRSEAFAEDVDHLLVTPSAVVAAPAAAGPRRSGDAARGTWRTQLVSAVFGGAQLAR